MYNIPTRMNIDRSRLDNNATYNYRTLNMFVEHEQFNNSKYNFATRLQNKQSLETTFPMSYIFNKDLEPEVDNSNINYGGTYINRAMKQSIPVHKQIEVDNVCKLPQSHSIRDNNIDIKQCNFLSSEHTRINNTNTKESSINRFQGIDNDLQDHIFWDFAKNTQLEARDNYKNKMGK